MAGTSARKEIADYAAQCRLWHISRTLPWSDKGTRLLPVTMFLDYKAEMNDRRDKFDQMVYNFISSYSTHVANAQASLGDLFDPNDYPDAMDVRDKFRFRAVFSPVPEAGDFRLDVPAEDMRELVSSFEAQQQEKLAEAVREPWERLHAELSAISKKLTDVEGDDAKKRYHDTLVSNPLELCALLTKLNITNDPKLEEARRELERTMSGVNIEMIKEDPHVRKDVKSRVDDILGRFDW